MLKLIFIFCSLLVALFGLALWVEAECDYWRDK